MSSENLDQEIRELVADVLELPAAEVGPATRPRTIRPGRRCAIST